MTYPLSDALKDGIAPNTHRQSMKETTTSPEAHAHVNSDKFTDNRPCVVTSTPLKLKARGNLVGSPTQRKKQRPVYPEPTLCPFFSNPYISNVDETRELWRQRLELAKIRGLRTTGSRAAELGRKANYIQRMDFIEGIQWGLPSEMDQCLFLMQLQAEEEAKVQEMRRVRDYDEESSGDEEECVQDHDRQADYCRHVYGREFGDEERRSQDDGYDGHAPSDYDEGAGSQDEEDWRCISAYYGGEIDQNDDRYSGSDSPYYDDRAEF